jgi:hypothetical protein
MSEREVFPPVQLSSSNATLYSVEIRTPSPVRDELTRYAVETGVPWDTIANNALMLYRESFMTRDDHARENVAWMIRNVGIPPKRARRLSLKQRELQYRRTTAELSQLRENGALGNLALDEEAYRYVVQGIESGAFASPTALVETALLFWVKQGRPKRADIVFP